MFFIFKDAEFAPTVNHLYQTIPTLYKQWCVALDINPTGTVAGYASIIHVGLGPDHASYGDRTPSIQFKAQTTMMHISSAVNGNENYYPSDTSPLPMNEWTQVEMSQLRLTDGSYQYTIKINDQIYDQIINNDAREFENIKVYTGDNYSFAPAATIRNLKINTFPESYVYNCKFSYSSTLNQFKLLLSCLSTNTSMGLPKW